jgi:hypothetical protein
LLTDIEIIDDISKNISTLCFFTYSEDREGILIQIFDPSGYKVEEHTIRTS